MMMMIINVPFWGFKNYDSNDDDNDSNNNNNNNNKCSTLGY
jgi:hypothetical protein